MTEKLYIDAITTYGTASPIEGYQVLALMRLPVEEATRKEGLATLIRNELKALDQEFPRPSKESEYVQWKQWKKDYHSAKKDRVNPLHNQHNVIKGQLEKYVVGAGNYKLGQVLDNVPADAVLADDFFMF